MLFSICIQCWTVFSGPSRSAHWSICHTQYWTGVLSWVKTGSIHAHTGHMDLDQQSVVSGLEKGSDVRTQ